MRMDGLDWSVEGPSSSAPTLAPQPAPPLPSFRDVFDGPDQAPPNLGIWRIDGGDWRQRDGELVQHDPGARPATALLAGMPPFDELLIEVNVRLVEASHQHSRYGLYLNHGPGDRTSLTFAADGSGLLFDREQDAQNPAGVRNWEPSAPVSGTTSITSCW